MAIPAAVDRPEATPPQAWPRQGRRLLGWGLASEDAHLDAERRNLAVFAALVALCGLAAYVVVSGLNGAYRSSDWPNEMILGRLLIADPGHLYDRAAQAAMQHSVLGPGAYLGSRDGLLNLSSPPWLGYLTAIFAPAGVTWGGILWSLAQLACLLAGLRLLARNGADALFAAATIPALVLVGNANVVGLVVLGFGLCTRLQDRHPWLAGLAMGLALIRPNVLLMLPVVFILNRRWRILGGSALALVALIASAEVRDPGLTLRWIATAASQAGHLGPEITPAGLGWMIGRHLGWVVSGVALAFGLWATRGRGPSVLPASLLAAPHALTQSLLMVSAGLVLARRCRPLELGILNVGSAALVLLSRQRVAEALVGTALIVTFTLVLSRGARQPAPAPWDPAPRT